MKTLFQSKKGSFLVIAVAVSLWLGCAASNQIEKAQNKSVQQMETLQEQSAGKIPCPSYQIEIPEHNINRTDGSGYWIAYCFGETYKCTRGSKDPQDVTCEQIPPEGME